MNEINLKRAVSHGKQITEQFIGYIPYDLEFIKTHYKGVTLKPTKITPIEQAIVGILSIDGDSTTEKLGQLLGLNVDNPIEKDLLYDALDNLHNHKSIAGNDTLWALTTEGQIYAQKGERPEEYESTFDVYVDSKHPTWLDLRKGIGENAIALLAEGQTCKDIHLGIEQIQRYAECQAPNVHYPKSRYLLRSASWTGGEKVSYRVYACIVQSIVNKETIRVLVYDENDEELKPLLTEYINTDTALVARLLKECIEINGKNIDSDLRILSEEQVVKVRTESVEELQKVQRAEQQLVEQAKETVPIKDGKLHKYSYYDTLTFEAELQNIFEKDNPDEIWLISPWIRSRTFLQVRLPLIQSFLSKKGKRVFIAYSKPHPSPYNPHPIMIDDEVRPFIKRLEKEFPNFFCVELPIFHNKDVFEVTTNETIMFSGSFNVLSFCPPYGETLNVRKENMLLAYPEVATQQYAQYRRMVAKIYADKIVKEVDELKDKDAQSYKDKNTKIKYFLSIDDTEIHDLFTPIEELLISKQRRSLNKRMIDSIPSDAEPHTI